MVVPQGWILNPVTIPAGDQEQPLYDVYRTFAVRGTQGTQYELNQLVATELFRAEAHKIGVMVHFLARPIEPVA